MCRSRRELSNAYLLAKIGVDTAENEPLEVWGENSIQYSLHSLGFADMKPDEKHLICPFVEVSFKNVDGDESAPVRTASSAALNTELININEALKIPLSTKGVEMTPQILSAHMSIIFFNVYDEVEIASQPDDRAHDVLTRKERRYLGSFELPFGTVYDNPKPIKGKLKE